MYTVTIGCVPCRDCNSTYFGEAGRSIIIRIEEHKPAFEKGDSKSELINHTLDTNHTLGFGCARVLAYG